MKRLLVALLGLFPLLAGCGPGGMLSPYHKKNGAWYFEKTELRLPRGETLTVLNSRFAKSATVVFYRDSPINEADAASFQALTDHYAKDNRAVYYADTYRKGQEYYMILYTRVVQLSGANPETFLLLDAKDGVTASGYGKDEDQVWYQGKPMEGVDAPSFVPLRALFAKDAKTVFYDLEPMPGPDPRSFEALDDHWSRDASRVFWSDIDLGSDPAGAHVQRVAEGANPGAFQALDGGYGKDPGHVWFEGELIDGADPATFVVGEGSDPGDARDRTGSYNHGQRVSGPPSMPVPVEATPAAAPKS